jgi:hypothetical protein
MIDIAPFLTRLLSEIAQVLGYKLQQLDVLEGGFYPQGLADIEVEQQAVRRSISKSYQEGVRLELVPLHLRRERWIWQWYRHPQSVSTQTELSSAWSNAV